MKKQQIVENIIIQMITIVWYQDIQLLFLLPTLIRYFNSIIVILQSKTNTWIFIEEHITL